MTSGRHDDSDRRVDIAATPNGNVGHILVNGDPVCPRNAGAEYNEVGELPSGGLCPNCKRRGQLIGLVEIPGTEDSPDV